MFVLTAPANLSEEVKKSRFLATAEAVGSASDALEFIERVSVADASHNCWAYRIGQAYRFSDDGEPSGSAGKPILAAIDGQQLDQAAVVVTRYFGGVKLGVGGLIRAYGGAAARCLQQAQLAEQITEVECDVSVPFDAVSVIHTLLARFEAEKINEEYRPSGIKMRLKLKERDLARFAGELRDATAGRAIIEESSAHG